MFKIIRSFTHVAFLTFAVFCAMLLLPACSSSTADPLLTPDLGPLEFSTLAELEEGLRTAELRHDLNFTEAYYYLPTGFSSALKLDSIWVKDRYIAFDYKAEPPLPTSDPTENTGKSELLDTVTFEWTRLEDGVKLLENTIKEQKLLPHGSGAGLYYGDIYWPDEPDTLLAKQFYWVQDGYRFSLHVPLALLEEDTVFGATKVWLADTEK